MALKECPHCLAQTFIDDKSEKWPCCGKLTKDDPKEYIEDIKFKKEKEKLETIISNTIKMTIIEIIAGILILIIVVGLIIVSSLSKTVFWYGGIILGAGLVIKGLVDIKDIFRMKKEYNEKFCYKIEIKNEMFIKE